MEGNSVERDHVFSDCSSSVFCCKLHENIGPRERIARPSPPADLWESERLWSVSFISAWSEGICAGTLPSSLEWKHVLTEKDSFSKLGRGMLFKACSF